MKDKLAEIKNRQKKLLFEGYYLAKETSVCEELLVPGAIPGTLCWSDIDYADQTRSAWGAAKHYSRILYALVSNGEERLRLDQEWREKLTAMLQYWLLNDFLNPNWWYNQIGVPQAMSNIMIMMENYLTPDMKEKLLEIISRGSMKENRDVECKYKKLKSAVTQWTGANLLWGAATTVKHALLIEDAELLALASERICEELDYHMEGIQRDGAFYQHGRRWYSGGYGRAFTFEIAPFVYCFQGTSYAFPKENVEILLKHVLDGQRLMQQKGYFDFGAVGREFTRPGEVHVGCLVPAVKLLAEADGIPRKKELQEMVGELTGEKEEIYEETKYFESIAFLRHGKADGYIGIRGSRGDLLGAEKCNQEGVLCCNMTYGTNTCFMRTGKEYYNLAPVWDYAKIPGTTARQESDEQLLAHEDSFDAGSDSHPTRNRVEAVTGTDCGILSQWTEHDGISLYASYFVFDGCMAALGTGIRDENPEKGCLVTTVDQCRAGEMTILDEGKYVENGGWSYRNLDNATGFTVDCGVKKGSWHRNNQPMSEEPVLEELFTLTIPVREGHNAYAYLVAGKETEVEVEVLCNDEDCQAILVNHKTVMAVFHKDATIQAAGKEICGQAGALKIQKLYPFTKDSSVF